MRARPASVISIRRRTTATGFRKSASARRSAVSRATNTSSRRRSEDSSLPDRAAPREQNGYVDVLPYRQRWDYSRSGTLRSIDESLQRLGVSRLDIVYIHDIDRDTHGDAHTRGAFDEVLSGAVPALIELREAGTIARLRARRQRLASVRRRAVARRPGHRAACRPLYAARPERALRTVAGLRAARCGARHRRPVQLGHPGDRRASGRRQRAVFQLCTGAAEIASHAWPRSNGSAPTFDVPLRAAALQFPLGHPAVASVIPGARTVAEFDQNLALATRAVPPAFWQALADRGLIPPDAPLPQGRS